MLPEGVTRGANTVLSSKLYIYSRVNAWLFFKVSTASFGTCRVMSLSSQFSLSVELTKLIPCGPLATVVGKGFLNLLRELRNSGSDLVTEEDLAAILGRNRIDPRFESTFRTAVKHSAVHRVADIAELMIEAGAGPTVRRSLKEPAYFNTVLQLSLLTYTHELTSLAKGLAQALERRARDASQSEPPPRYDALKGTLRACREQTSGFMWELILAAVDEQISHVVVCETPQHTRAIPVPVLQALLDAFTAVQYLPEARLIHISSNEGAATVVVWAHHVLGLTTVVESPKGTVRFGEGPESVYFDCDPSSKSRVIPYRASLLNETNDLLFGIDKSFEDVTLDPVLRHPFRGYGLKRLRRSDAVVVPGIVHAVFTSCLAIAQEDAVVHARESESCGIGKRICPKPEKLFKVACILFPGYEDMMTQIDIEGNLPCVARSDWSVSAMPPDLARHVQEKKIRLGSLRKEVLDLSRLTLVLSMVDNIEACEGLSLDMYSFEGEEGYSALKQPQQGELAAKPPLGMPDAREAFETLALLLRGKDFPKVDDDVGRAAVISAWGWTICTGSVLANDPSEMNPGIAVTQGVPMRDGERKRLIVDAHSHNQSIYESYDGDKPSLGNWTAVASPGDHLALSTWTRSKKTRYFIAPSDYAFEVMKVYACHAISNPEVSWDIRLGFHEMQRYYWETFHVFTCEHSAKLNQVLTLPEDTWAFQGFAPPPRFLDGTGTSPAPYLRCKKGSLHVGLVAGDISARWILLIALQTRWYLNANPDQNSRDSASVHRGFLRGRDCCFGCAIDAARSQRNGRHIALVL